MLYKLHAHGTYIDDILFGVIFVVKLAIFFVFYFTDKGEPELEEHQEAEPPQST
jgi:hypothetical protein